MRRLFPLMGLLLAGASAAQTGFFQGVTPRPPDIYPLPASLTVSRTAPEGGVPNVVPALYTHVTTQPDVADARMGEPDGAQQPVRLRRERRLLQPGAEDGARRDVGGRAGIAGRDGPRRASTRSRSTPTRSGPSPTPGSMDGDRIGLGIILGRAFNTGPKATVDYGVFIAPHGVERRRGRRQLRHDGLGAVPVRVLRDACRQQDRVRRVRRGGEQVRSGHRALGAVQRRPAAVRGRRRDRRVARERPARCRSRTRTDAEGGRARRMQKRPHARACSAIAAISGFLPASAGGLRIEPGLKFRAVCAVRFQTAVLQWCPGRDSNPHSVATART